MDAGPAAAERNFDSSEEMTLAHLQPHQWDEVAQLVHTALDSWYRKHLNIDRFGTDWEPFRVFTEIYESLDPGRCLIAMDEQGKLIGSIFYHPRETHIGIGVVTTHPAASQRGIAKAMLQEIIAQAAGKPLRLVSSAMNLDSFSLYTKLGFVPHATFQDLSLTIPESGLPGAPTNVRPATPADAVAMADLELRLNGIRRQHDYDFFLTNPGHHWRTLIVERDGVLIGFLNACTHPASRILGPGVSEEATTMCQLVHAMLDLHFRGQAVIWLAPVNCPLLVQQAYGWGARNIELHLASTRGQSPPLNGITIPTFMPESG
jgi:GNAT superfamily N-acetyltransferase